MFSPCDVLVVEGVDGVPPDRSHPYQRAVHTRHCHVHLLHVVIVPMIFRPVVHLKQENNVLGNLASDTCALDN